MLRLWNWCVLFHRLLLYEIWWIGVLGFTTQELIFVTLDLCAPALPYKIYYVQSRTYKSTQYRPHWNPHALPLCALPAHYLVLTHVQLTQQFVNLYRPVPMYDHVKHLPDINIWDIIFEWISWIRPPKPRFFQARSVIIEEQQFSPTFFLC